MKTRETWLISLAAVLPLATGCLSLRTGMGVPTTGPMGRTRTVSACLPVVQYHQTHWHRMIEIDDCIPFTEEEFPYDAPSVEEYYEIEQLPTEAMPEEGLSEDILPIGRAPSQSTRGQDEKSEAKAAPHELRPLNLPSTRWKQPDPTRPDGPRREIAPLPPPLPMPAQAAGLVVPASATSEIVPSPVREIARTPHVHQVDLSLVPSRVLPAE